MSQTDYESAVSIINLYGLAVDTTQWDLFDAIFTKDVVAVYGTGKWQDLKTFKHDFSVYHIPFASTQHTMTSVNVKFNVDKGRVLTYGN